jgi:prevent-host-death family protein
MNQTVTLKEVREQLSELVARVAYGDQKVVITKFGKPLAAIVNFEDYEKLMNPSSRFTDEEWEKGFEFITKAQDASKDISDEEADKIIEREIAAVRSEKNDKSSS